MHFVQVYMIPTGPHLVHMECSNTCFRPGFTGFRQVWRLTDAGTKWPQTQINIWYIYEETYTFAI